MTSIAPSRLGAVLLLAALLPAAAESLPPNQRPPTEKAPLTALDRYVHAPDPAYAWKVAGTARGEGGEAIFIDLTSQSWLTTNEVDRPLWKHWLVVARPDELRSRTALLYIGGGNNQSDRPPRVNAEMARIARETGSIVAELRMVPNQPLVFHGDGEERVEDDLIAYGWDQYLRGKGEKWLARLPMTKAAVRAMDALQEFAEVRDFVVAGGSKRGWTTWTTAIVDRRVIGICPIVIDLLNLEESMFHHFRAYGFWAPAVGDYVRHGIMDWMQTPEMNGLLKLVDPYSYRDRLTLPKLMLNAAGDQFFLPDSSQFFFDDLSGPKFLRYVPNADHSLRESDAFDTLLAWHHAMVQGTGLPEFKWSHAAPGEVRVQPATRPVEARLWKATNPAARDFRLETLGPKWTSETLAADADGNFSARVEKPAAGWTAYMVELTFNTGAPRPLKLTTDVRVIPDTLPFPAPEPRRR